MSIQAPQVLHVMNESSGTTVTNYGTSGSNSSVTLAPEATGFSWHPGAGLYGANNGYWQSLAIKDADMAQINMDATVFATTFDSGYLACGFRLTSFDTTTGHAYVVGGGDGSGGGFGFVIEINAPSGGGDFDVKARFNASTFGGVASRVFAACTFGTDYQLVMTIDTSTIGSTVAKFKLDSGSILTASEGTVNFSGEHWPVTTGRVNGANEWDGGNNGDTFAGFLGRVYYVAHYRGGVLADADMNALNADPTTIPGWPASGGSLPSRRFGLCAGASSAEIGRASGNVFRKNDRGLLVPAWSM